MKRHNGWTLIELVLALLLISIFGSLILKISLSNDIFSRYMFQNKLIDAVAQAKSLALYSKTDVQVEIKDSTLWFVPLTQADKSKGPWSVKMPQNIEYDNSRFPVILGTSSQGNPLPLTFKMPHTHLVLDTQTAVAYAVSP